MGTPRSHKRNPKESLALLKDPLDSKGIPWTFKEPRGSLRNPGAQEILRHQFFGNPLKPWGSQGLLRDSEVSLCTL
eukprot:9119030-Pyramimonas_sp.AAC.1